MQLIEGPHTVLGAVRAQADSDAALIALWLAGKRRNDCLSARTGA